MKAYSYIRFSTAGQIRGDSLRRQATLAAEWCKANDVILTEDYRDLGISAFRGKNAAQGALAAFLALVEQGRIAPGDALIVESLDRITRADLSDALALFLRIINAGIVVVTLADNRRYDRATINEGLGELMISLVVLSRANEESRTKSRRGLAWWAAKRDKAAPGVLASCRVPTWLRQNGQAWEILPERVAIVREMFSLAAAGFSSVIIADRLNEAGHPRLASKGPWNHTAVSHFLRQRAVIGEYHMSDGRIVAGYYPAIITPAQFYEVARLMDSRMNKQGNKTKGENLFRGLVVTPDGYPITIHGIRFRRGPEKHYYLTCTHPTTRKSLGSWAYKAFRALFLALVTQASEAPAPPAAINPRPADAARGELEAMEARLANLTTALANGYSQTLEAALRAAESARDAQRQAVARLEAEQAAPPPSLGSIDWRDSATLQANIRRVVSRIVIDLRARAFRVELRSGEWLAYAQRGEAHEIKASFDLAQTLNGPQ